MSNRIAVRRSFVKKAVLAAAGMAAPGLPFVAGFMNTAGIRAQSSPPQAAPGPHPNFVVSPKFEVASVRPAISLSEYLRGFRASGSRSTNTFQQREFVRKVLADLKLQISGRRVDTEGMSMKALISEAYRIDSRLIVALGSIQQGDEARFAIHAIMPEGTTNDQVPDMLKALLEERFHMVAHRAVKEDTAYALMAAKNGPKLKPPRDIDRAACSLWEDAPERGGSAVQVCTNRRLGITAMTNTAWGPWLASKSTEGWRIEYFRITMPQLAQLLTQRLSSGGAYEPDAGSVTQVVDLTGIDRAWDVVLYGQASEPDTPSSLSSPLAQQGLRLERTTAKVETLIIEKVDKIPTEN